MPPEDRLDPAAKTDVRTADQIVEIVTDVIGRHQFSHGSHTCRCDWTGSPADHPGHVAQRLAIVGVLKSGGPQ